MQSQAIMKLTDDDKIEKIIKAASQKIFYAIYDAAKEQNADVLSKIREEYLSNQIGGIHAFSVHVDGHTPLSLLTFEGDYASAEFLLGKAEGDFQGAIIGCAHRSDRPRIFNFELISISDSYYFLLTAERISIYLKNQQNELAQAILNRFINKDRISILVEAMLGNVQGVNLLLEKNVKNLIYTEKYIKKTMRPDVAYCYGLKGHQDAINLIWLEGSLRERISLIQGSLEGGHIRQIEDVVKKSWFANLMTSFLYDFAIPAPSNLLYPDVLFKVLSHLNFDLLRKNIHVAVFLEMYLGIDKTEKNAKQKILDDSCIVNHYYQNYHLDFYQSLVCSRKEIIAWLFEGMRLVKKGNLLPDLLVKILSFIVSPQLTEVELTDLLQKVYFAINKSFLIADLDAHLAELYKQNQDCKKTYKIIKIESVKDQCTQVESLNDLKSFVHQQYRLFCPKIAKDSKGNVDENKQERQERQELQKEFGNILKKHNRRL